MSRSIWWHLAMRFHAEPTPGHSVGKAKDCWMCQEFAKCHEAVSASAQSDGASA